MYIAYKYSQFLDTSAFSCSDSECCFLHFLTSEMANKQKNDATTNQLLQEMMKQMSVLQEKVDTIQKNPPTLEPRPNSDDEMEATSGGLMQLTETTKTFLEAAFSTTMLNENRRKRVEKIGVPDCDQVRCPKLDGVLKAVLPKDAIKTDRVYNNLAPLAAILESTEAGVFNERPPRPKYESIWNVDQVLTMFKMISTQPLFHCRT